MTKQPRCLRSQHSAAHSNKCRTSPCPWQHWAPCWRQGKKEWHASMPQEQHAYMPAAGRQRTHGPISPVGDRQKHPQTLTMNPEHSCQQRPAQTASTKNSLHDLLSCQPAACPRCRPDNLQRLQKARVSSQPAHITHHSPTKLAVLLLLAYLHMIHTWRLTRTHTQTWQGQLVACPSHNTTLLVMPHVETTTARRTNKPPAGRPVSRQKRAY